MTLWADDLYMSVPYLARMGKLTGDNKYFDFAIKQVEQFNKYIYDEATGLYFHTFFNDENMNGVARWGRCNGWVALAQVELLNNLPANHPVWAIAEDHVNPNLLFVGTEFGLFASLDAGKSWQKFMNNYPTVRTDDILIHPRDNDLIVASHGRSVWIADDITPLQQLTPAVRATDATLFDIRPAIAWLNDQQNNQQVGGQKVFVGENAPRGAAINYYLKANAGDVKISIADVNGRTIRTLEAAKTAGINRVMWNLAPQPPQGQQGGGGGGGGGRGGAGAVEPGTYIVTLEVGGKKLTKPLQVLQDRWLNER